MSRFVRCVLLATSAALACVVPIGCGSSSSSDATPAPEADAATEAGPTPAVEAGPTDAPATLTLTLDAAETEIVAGGTATLAAHAIRGPSSNGPITLTLVGLPAGVTAAPATIADGQTQGTVTLSAAAGAAQGLAKISATGALGGVTASAATSVFVRGAPGTLDTSFGASGVMFNPQSAILSELHASAVQGDSKILVGGELYASGSNTAHVVRIDESGKLDATFGDAGTAAVGFATGGAESFYGLAVTPAGSIVGGGFTFTGSASDRAIAARLGPDGKLDLTFNATGKYITSFPGTEGARGMGMILQKDGKLTLVGEVPAGQGTWGAARVTAQGGTDAMFGGGGAILPGPTSGGLQCGGEQSDGKLVLAGGLFEASTLKWGITRLVAATGAVDAGYGTLGFAKLSFGASSGIFACRVDPADKLVAAGYLVEGGIGKIAVGRFGKDGTFDPTFHAGQPVSVPLGAGGAYPTGVFLQKDGKIVVAGNSTAGILTVLRFGADGTLDPSFGSGGSLTTSGGLSGLANLSYSSVDETRRRVVLAGNASLGATGGWFVSRVWL